MAFIYKITNNVTGQIYVGKTTRLLSDRFKDHHINAKSGKSYLYSAIRIYGIDQFSISELEECSKDRADECERFWIEFLQSKAPNGYNMSDGGTGGDMSSSPNFIESMKIYHDSKPKKEYATYGFANKTHSKETIKSQSVARTNALEITVG